VNATARTAATNSVIKSPEEQIMADAFAQQSPSQPAPAPATVVEVMRPPLTTVEQDDHVAAAAYLMKHAGTTALMILDAQTDQPIGIITEADIAHAVADGKDVNNVRIHDLMTTRPTVINTTTSVRDAAEIMASGRFRHLPVVSGAGLVGIVDIVDVCRALINPDVSTARTPAGEQTRTTASQM
jgi:CBS domain-containing protein